jgi:hypothetical protein
VSCKSPVNGNQYIKKPRANKINVRFKMVNSTVDLPNFSTLGKTKLSELPTANKKDGNTKSVGVNPCQLACLKGAKVCNPSPGELTIIIKHIVIPRKTSNDKNLSLFIAAI